MSPKKKLLVFLMNSVPFGLLFFLLAHSFELVNAVWYYIVVSVFYGLMAVYLRPKMIVFLNKKWMKYKK
jgi:hypothetical protein